MSCEDKPKEEKEKPIKIQNTFLKERKVFLWGEVSDKSARDVTEKLLYLEMAARRAHHLLHQLPRWLDHRGHGDLRHDEADQLPDHSRCHWHGCEHGLDPALRRRQGQTPPLPALTRPHPPAAHFLISDIHIQADGRRRRRHPHRDFYMTAAEAIEYGLADAVVEKI